MFRQDVVRVGRRFVVGLEMKIRNEQIRGTAQVEWLGDKVREARLRWFGRIVDISDKGC